MWTDSLAPALNQQHAPHLRDQLHSPVQDTLLTKPQHERRLSPAASARRRQNSDAKGQGRILPL